MFNNMFVGQFDLIIKWLAVLRIFVYHCNIVCSKIEVTAFLKHRFLKKM